MKDSEKELLGDKSRRRFFRHTCDASMRGDLEYDRSDKWSRDVRLGYLKSAVVAQSSLQVLNISEGGIALVSQYPAVKKAIVSLKILTAFDSTIRIKGRVKWSKRLKKSSEAYVIGCEFVKMSRSDERNLKELLRIFEQSQNSQATAKNEN